jgi:DNA-binding MarR family transcriptional regulator
MKSRYEDSILRSLRRVARANDLYSRQLARQHKLTTPQILCLRHLHEQGTSTPSATAKAVALSQPTITGIFDRLEARGLLTRTRHSRDKRRVDVRLTERGRELVAASPSPLHQRFSNNLAKLPEGEQAMIDWVLNRIVEMMEGEDRDEAETRSAKPKAAAAGGGEGGGLS